jgi:hypothetical protein
MKIYELTCITESVANAFKKLIPQLGPGIPVPDISKLEEIIVQVIPVYSLPKKMRYQVL